MSRALILLYGIFGYGLFLFTILFAIGFIGNFAVPKSIDSGEPGPWPEAFVVNGLLLALFVVQHTVMARPAFKRWWTQFIPTAIERSTFVILASAILLLLFWQWRPMPAVLWHVDQPWLAGMLFAIQLSGWAIVFYSSFLIDHFDLFGLRQVVLHARGVRYEQHPFLERSLYKVVRHPLMAGFLVAFWATPTMTIGHLFFALMTTGYIFFGVWMEERDLVHQHAPAYDAYRQRTPMLVPLRLRKPITGERTSSPIPHASSCPIVHLGSARGCPVTTANHDELPVSSDCH
jgi:methanethiol S-methyltransferase